MFGCWNKGATTILVLNNNSVSLMMGALFFASQRHCHSACWQQGLSTADASATYASENKHFGNLLHNTYYGL